MGPSGITALSGQVLDQSGRGLAEVQLLIGATSTRTDAQGRFLLGPVMAGKTVLQIDGRHAGPTHSEDHGFYEARVETRGNMTTVLPYRSWLPLIDHTHDVTIPSPTRAPVIVRTSLLPGFELHIPAGVVVKDVDGKVVTSISLVTMPKDRTPVPLLVDFSLPVFVSIQPGAACLYDTTGGIGTAQIYYPNSRHELPKARATFWRYEPDGDGWVPYGIGTVGADGSQVAPDAETIITEFGSAECDPRTRTRAKPLAKPDQRLLRRLAP